jgi:hypothetical protein
MFGCLGFFEHELDGRAEVAGGQGAWFVELEEDFMGEHQPRGNGKLSILERPVLGQAQREGNRNLPATAHHLFGNDLAAM